jgi:hypothetical protein
MDLSDGESSRASQANRGLVMAMIMGASFQDEDENAR